MQPIKTDEKTGVVYRKWDVSSPEAVLLLVHGLGAHTGRWRFLADFFLRHNVSSYAVELKGFGDTKGERGHVDSANVYFSDICHLCDIAQKENPEKKIFLVGESVGGLISFTMSARCANLFSGLICISPAFAGKIGVKMLDYIKMFSALLYDPKKQFSVPFTAEMCTRDYQYQKIMNEDPMEHRLVSARLVFEIVKLQKGARKAAGKINIPALFLISGRDKLVNPIAARKVFDAIAAKEKKLAEYPEMYHALSVDIGRENVFGDMMAWLHKNTA